jgi:RNA polymerase sigma-70 factor, ECF subfamily
LTFWELAKRSASSIGPEVARSSRPECSGPIATLEKEEIAPAKPATTTTAQSSIAISTTPIVGRTPEAARQLASRGRRRVQRAAPNPDTDPTHQRKIVGAFLAASRAGDFDALLAALDPDVVFRADAGRIRPLARPPTTGAAAVATEMLSRGSRFASQARPALVNGTAGLVVGPRRKPFAVVGYTISHGRIVAIDLIANPDKLRGLLASSE